ncbi:hypothetical protein LAZ67_6003311 [Cordylochernes scorpioides]|uniref:CCHC-type domain-containing protein n=1 Tax=Cordylochernes scorpioides TaxID=51811 RepID=A0ABY6KKI8_9ARAC|nr:hypothetical protein LAZ67_6003311 [Cordylochernes scorpioides]
MADMFQLNIPRLDGNNFASWKFRNLFVLEGKALAHLLVQDSPKDEAEKAKLIQQDAQAKVRNEVSRLQRKKEEKWQEYILRAEEMLENARILGAEIDEEEFTNALIKGLPSKYNIIAMQIDSMDNPNIDNIRRLFELYQERYCTQEKDEHSSAYEVYNKNKYKHYKETKASKMYKCFICHKQGHKANECWHNPENNGKTMVKQTSQLGPSEYKTNTPNKYQKAIIVKEEKATEWKKAERFNRTLIEGTRALLIESQLPTKFWAEAMNTFVYVKSRTPSKNNERFTPEELFSNRKPTVSHFKIFGCHAEIFISKHKRSKLECTTQSGIFFGYSSERKAYRICDPKDFSITESRDVIFLEDKMGAALLDNDNTTKTQDYSLIEIFENDNSEETFPLQEPEDVAESQEENLISPNQTSPRYNLRPNVRDQIYYELSSDEEPIFDNEDKDPTYEPDEEAFKVSHGDLLPSSYEEAISNPDSTLWRQAMNKEIHSLKDHHVWNLIELPQGAKHIKSKWVFSKKIELLTNKEIFKAKLVALGCSQKYGADYNETFSPVMKTDSFRTLLAYATMMDYEFHHFDVETAFLYGKLTETIYMTQPEGYQRQDRLELASKQKKRHQLGTSCEQSDKPRAWLI